MLHHVSIQGTKQIFVRFSVLICVLRGPDYLMAQPLAEEPVPRELTDLISEVSITG